MRFGGRTASGGWSLALMALVALACADDDDDVTGTGDVVPPAAVTDLRAEWIDGNRARLRWTAPGDDGLTGQAAAYDLRIAPGPRREEEWIGADSLAAGLPRPAGVAETLLVEPLSPDSVHVFALRSADEAGNRSRFSNAAVLVPAGTGGVIVPSTTRMEFGFRRIGEEVDRTLVLWNRGTARATLELLSLTREFVLPGGSGPYEVAAGDSLVIRVRFRPIDPGDRRGTIWIFPGLQVACRGVGAENLWDPLEAPVAAGRHRIGTRPEEPGYYPGEAAHDVELTRAVLVSDHEVVQQEWTRVMEWDDSEPDGAFLPANRLTWFDAVEYCNRCSVRDGLFPAYALTEVQRSGEHIAWANVAWSPAANGYRLPTEAEWEAACRAGTTTAFYTGEITVVEPGECSVVDPRLDLAGWYCANSGGLPQEITRKAINQHWLHDMLGNVSEWCWDWYADYSGEAEVDPSGPAVGSDRVHRGGSFAATALECRGASRAADRPDRRTREIGLRLVRNAE